MGISLKSLLAISALSFSMAAATSALAYDPLITVDENGHGTIDFCGPGCPTPLPGVLAPDPGPGGLASTLTYNLLGPPSLTDGDLLIFDPDGTFSDVVRFNDYGTGNDPTYQASLVFYSNPLDGFDSLADTPSPPSAFYSNSLDLTEVNGQVFYHPTAGQPGFVPGFNVAYEIISDAVVPEPAAWALMTLGLGGIGGAVRASRSRKMAAATA
jgi:hypothetical protein